MQGLVLRAVTRQRQPEQRDADGPARLRSFFSFILILPSLPLLLGLQKNAVRPDANLAFTMPDYEAAHALLAKVHKERL